MRLQRVLDAGGGAEEGLAGVLGVVAQTLRTVGEHRIELVTITRDRVSLQPVHLVEGEAIAHVLGLDVPLDHRMFVPGHTLWTGEVEDLEVQVRSVLRRPVGAVR